MATAIPGVNAAGRQPVFIIQGTELPDLTSSSSSIPASKVTAGTKIDCYYNFGGVELSREAITKEQQRACQKVAETIKIGETISGTITAVFDQQATSEAEVNKAYAALPEGAEVFLFVAHGWDTEKAPEATKTRGDLWKMKVSQVHKGIAASAEEDITFTATLNGSAYWSDITLTA